MSYHAKRELSPASIPGPSSHAKHARHADDVDELAGSDDGFPALETGAPTPAKEVNDDGETFFSLGETRRLTLREFKGKPLVDIREFYEKDGQHHPGKKGCALSPAQWAALRAGPHAALLAEDDGDAPSWADAGPAGDGGGVQVNGEGEKFYPIGELRRVSLREVKGREVVDVREFYFKDGEEKPGMKGVTLSLDEWRALLKAPVDLSDLPVPPAPGAKKPAAASAAAKAKDPKAAPAAPAKETKAAAGKRKASEDAAGLAKFEANDQGEKFLRLGNNRRLTVRSFKGKPLVDIREYYTKDGEEKPGAKGVSLAPEQWELVRSSVGAVDRLLEGLKK